ncbi:MAG: penicillin acylase family protein [Bacteroidota bacterium]
MRILLLYSVLVFHTYGLLAQINPKNIQIARDTYGVPHVFAPTDVEVAYGFAWATAEDDFDTMQRLLLPGRGLAGLVLGKEGAFMDVASHLVGSYAIAKEKYQQELSPDFRKIVEAYAAGANAYAEAHPKEVLHKDLFPVDEVDVIQGYVLGMTLISQADGELNAILNERLNAGQIAEARGSNAFAISKDKTTEGKTYFVSNSHQPLEGVNSWYEAHLCSEEGWNILGASFAGGLSIFTGVNETLGWAHTVNYPDLADVYALTMHPDKKLHYKFDGEWLALQPYHTKARIKLMGFLPLGIKKKYYKSKYGVTIETDQGFFAWRFPANQNIQAAEQWYRMNKATNFQEFQEALSMRGIVSTNIIYADKEDNIFYISNGRFPVRDKGYEWDGVVRGDTSATLWENDYYPIDSLPQVLNPTSGYVYNTNNSPFRSSGEADNPKVKDIPSTTGFQLPDDLSNRGIRFRALIDTYDKLSYEDLKRIKYDQAYHNPFLSNMNIDTFLNLSGEVYPEVAESLDRLNAWDRVMKVESEEAAIFLLANYYIRTRKYRKDKALKDTKDKNAIFIGGVKYAEEHLLKHFGRKYVPLGEVQQHRRGDVSLPFGGGPEVLAAIYSTMQKDGRMKPVAGESYIQLVKFSGAGPEIESVNAYGASAKPESPHFTDQMELYTKQKLKPMTLDKETVLKNAKKVYHPE